MVTFGCEGNLLPMTGLSRCYMKLAGGDGPSYSHRGLLSHPLGSPVFASQPYSVLIEDLVAKT